MFSSVALDVKSWFKSWVVTAHVILLYLFIFFFYQFFYSNSVSRLESGENYKVDKHFEVSLVICG